MSSRVDRIDSFIDFEMEPWKRDEADWGMSGIRNITIQERSDTRRAIGETWNKAIWLNSKLLTVALEIQVWFIQVSEDTVYAQVYIEYTATCLMTRLKRPMTVEYAYDKNKQKIEKDAYMNDKMNEGKA